MDDDGLPTAEHGSFALLNKSARQVACAELWLCVVALHPARCTNRVPIADLKLKPEHGRRWWG